MKHYFIEINESKALLLLDIFAHLCWPCSNDMHSQNVNVLMKNLVAGVGIRQKYRNGSMVLIKLIDQLIVNKRLSFKGFYVSMFAYILCNTNLTQYMVLC